ncbi:hypothetical protein C8J57DRAFT_599190 [Mycena rebaudengoi]|nr:hypothetical protein C8J57DRAFT_599190 [Mycena rebaudengoi]
MALYASSDAEHIKLLGHLRPITSNDTGRYEGGVIVDPFHTDIYPGLTNLNAEPEPEYLPSNWSAHVHPEGKLYFAFTGSLRVVTEDYMYQSAVLERVCAWILYIEARLAEKKVQISSEIELFIKTDASNCDYYFVDHATRSQVWLDICNTQDLGLPPVVSPSHLQILLRELYWIHVERFPSMTLSTQTIDALISVFSHGACDQMTSRVSTFPYTAKDCTTFMKILKQSKDNLSDRHTTWIVARLWALVDHNMYLTHYGQEHARLSRDQAILYDDQEKYTWVSTVISTISFTASDEFLERLNDVFVDRIVYANHWKTFMEDCLQHWRRATPVALSGLLLHLPFLLLGSSNSAFLAVSASLFGCSLIASTFLIHKYESMKNITAAKAMDYLDTIQSQFFKFQLVALVFSLPKALHLWGSVLLLGNAILFVMGRLSFEVAMILLGVAMGLMLGLYCITSSAFISARARFACLLRMDREEPGVAMV